MIEQVNLNPYHKSTFHVNVDYNFDEKKWKWGSDDEVDDILWARDDNWFYPIDRVTEISFPILQCFVTLYIKEDLIQIEVEICGDESVISWTLVRILKKFFLVKHIYNFKSIC